MKNCKKQRASVNDDFGTVENMREDPSVLHVLELIGNFFKLAFRIQLEIVSAQINDHLARAIIKNPVWQSFDSAAVRRAFAKPDTVYLDVNVGVGAQLTRGK